MGSIQCVAVPEKGIVSSCQDGGQLSEKVGPCLLSHHFNHSPKGQDVQAFSALHTDSRSDWVSSDQVKSFDIFGTRLVLGEKSPLEGPSGAVTLMNEGIARQKKGDSQGALLAFRGALQIRQACFTGTDLTHFTHRDFHTLLLLFKEAREMSECTGTQNSVDGAALLAIFGMLCHLCGDSDSALEAYTKAFKILEEVGAFETDEWIAVLLSLGDARCERGDYESALEAYREIHRVYDRKGSLQSYDGAVLLMSIGTAKHARGDFQGALEFYEKASNIFEATGHGDTNTCATLLNNVGMTTHKCERFVDALNAFWKAHAIRERTGTLDMPEGRQLCQNLERAKQMFRGAGTSAEGDTSRKNPNKSPKSSVSKSPVSAMSSSSFWRGLSPRRSGSSNSRAGESPKKFPGRSLTPSKLTEAFSPRALHRSLTPSKLTEVFSPRATSPDAGKGGSTPNESPPKSPGRSLSPTWMFSQGNLSPRALRTGGASPHKREPPVPGCGKGGRSRVPALPLSGLNG